MTNTPIIVFVAFVTFATLILGKVPQEYFDQRMLVAEECLKNDTFKNVKFSDAVSFVYHNATPGAFKDWCFASCLILRLGYLLNDTHAFGWEAFMRRLNIQNDPNLNATRYEILKECADNYKPDPDACKATETVSKCLSSKAAAKGIKFVE